VRLALVDFRCGSVIFNVSKADVRGPGGHPRQGDEVSVMRKLERGEALAVRAIGGLHVVTLAWDFVAGQEAKRDK